MKYEYEFPPGLSAGVVKRISSIKDEPKWMLDFRLKSLKQFYKLPLPSWLPQLKTLDFGKIRYYVSPTEKQAHSWKDVPENIKRTFEKLGIPQAEREFLAGVGAQWESTMIYHQLQKQLAKKGVIFCDMNTAIREHPKLVKKYLGTVVPIDDNKFAALNSACLSGGTFLYVPKGVKVELPLQAYFRIDAERIGQFERTLIIAEEGSEVHYIEACGAPLYSIASLHAAVVEVIAKKNSRIRYTTLQNWATNVFNLVTKRAYAYENAYVEWVDANNGSLLTAKYPSIFLLGKGAKTDILSVAFAGKGQLQDTGARVFHYAPNTSSTILSKSVSKDGGKTIFRGTIKVLKGAHKAKSHMKCDALILDHKSSSDTIPSLKADEDDVSLGHEAVVGKIGEEQLFYLMSRGFSKQEAVTMIVSGFLQPFIKQLPLEYALEFNRLIMLEIEKVKR